MLSENLLCIIPAKGSSTRLKRKNIAMLCGKPMIAYSIEAARDAGIFDEIFVSTDDEEIKNISESLGAVVPYKRPEALSRDPAGVVDVCLHMIEYFEKNGKFYETLFILLPTSPLRTAEDIISALNVYRKSGVKVLMSVSEYAHPPFSALKLDNNGYLTPYFPDYINLKSQQMPKAYICNGAITILEVSEFKRKKNYYFYPMAAYIMPREKSVDIDNTIDLKFAQYLMSSCNE
jgi:CMP-N,N'-diacetyllegionaminic acid synthase